MIDDALRQTGYGHVAGTEADDDGDDGLDGIAAVR